MRRLGLSALYTIFPFLLAIMRPGMSAVLTIPDQVVRPGEVIVSSLSLNSEGQAISGVQFDIEWDAGIDLQTAATPLVGASGKDLQVIPREGNTLRYLIVGFNQKLIPDGGLVKLFLWIPPGTAPGTVSLRLTHAAAVSPEGQAVELRSGASSILIQGGGTGTPVFQAEAFLNAASLLSAPVSPGEIISLLGSAGADGLLFNGVPATILYTGTNQLNAIVPFGLAVDAPAAVDVMRGGTAARVSLPVAAAAPALFTQSANGTGPGAILNQDFTVNSASNPAPRDSFVMLYGTGFGTLDPPAADGQTAGQARHVLPVVVQIGGIPAEVNYAGSAPGLIYGVTQVNARVPKDLPPNSLAPVSITAGPFSIPAGVTVFVK